MDFGQLLSWPADARLPPRRRPNRVAGPPWRDGRATRFCSPLSALHGLIRHSDFVIRHFAV